MDKNEIKELLSFKSKIGIWFQLFPIGLVILIVLLFAPFATYDTSNAIRESSEQISGFSLGVPLIGLIFLVASALLFIIWTLKLVKGKLEEKKGINNLLIIAAVFCGIYSIFTLISSSFVEVPGEPFETASIGWGAIVSFIISIVMTSGLIMCFIIMKQLLNGKMTLEQIMSHKNKKNEESISNANGSIEDKLVELNAIKEKGLISEEEYIAKKKALLEEYK